MYTSAQEFRNAFGVSRGTAVPDAQTSLPEDSTGPDGSGLAFPSAAAEAEFERRCRLSRLGNRHLEDTGVEPVATESGPDLPLESAAMCRST